MKSKEYLLQIRKYDTLINNKLAEIYHWKTVACSTGTYSEGERVQSSGNPHKMESAVDMYADMQAEITADIDKFIDLKREVIKTIEVLPVTEYDILHKIYVQGQTLDEVAENYDKSRRWADSVHGRALASLQRLLDERKKDETKV